MKLEWQIRVFDSSQIGNNSTKVINIGTLLWKFHVSSNLSAAPEIHNPSQYRQNSTYHSGKYPQPLIDKILSF